MMLMCVTKYNNIVVGSPHFLVTNTNNIYYYYNNHMQWMNPH